MKKGLLMVAVLMCVAAPVFAQMPVIEISAGGGGGTEAFAIVGHHYRGESGASVSATQSSIGFAGLANEVIVPGDGSFAAAGTMTLGVMWGESDTESFSGHFVDTATPTELGTATTEDNTINHTETHDDLLVAEVTMPTIGLAGGSNVNRKLTPCDNLILTPYS